MISNFKKIAKFFIAGGFRSTIVYILLLLILICFGTVFRHLFDIFKDLFHFLLKINEFPAFYGFIIFNSNCVKLKKFSNNCLRRMRAHFILDLTLQKLVSKCFRQFYLLSTSFHFHFYSYYIILINIQSR